MSRSAAARLIAELFTGMRRMILPLTACPGAPAQGALAIECRADDARLRAVLAAIDDAPTRAAVAAERALLAERGGGYQRLRRDGGGSRGPGARSCTCAKKAPARCSPSSCAGRPPQRYGRAAGREAWTAAPCPRRPPRSRCRHARRAGPWRSAGAVRHAPPRAARARAGTVNACPHV
ncbi:MAG: hypothetical protein U1F30_05995 [Steroidobacteraceae bacterium]